MSKQIFHKNESNPNVRHRNPKWPKARALGAALIKVGISSVICIGAIGSCTPPSRVSDHKKTGCLDSLNDLRNTISEVEALNEKTLKKLELMTVEQNLKPDFENDPSSKEIKEIMGKRADLNLAIWRKWRAWVNCSESTKE